MAALEEIAPLFKGQMTYSLINISKREGLDRLRELRPKLGRRPAVPSILINETIAFDHIPDSDALVEAIRQRLQ
jgi:hypothetical protein